MSNLRQSLGRWGESIAARYLESHGYHIQERNARTPYGEIDIVALQPEVISQSSVDPSSVAVFVEVKTRTSTTLVFPKNLFPCANKHICWQLLNLISRSTPNWEMTGVST